MAREQPDPYDVLGVSRQASESEVARAYRRAARATHPDAGCADTERFREVHHAYETLRNARRRAEHDRTEVRRAAIVSVGPHIVLGAPQGLNAVRRGLFIEVKTTNDH